MNIIEKIFDSADIEKIFNDVNSMYMDSPEIDFMNHGYLPLHPNSLNVFLEPSASLYLHLIDRIKDTNNKSILEVGCGRGGGAKLIRKHYNFSEVVGCDINEMNIKHCNLDSLGCNFLVSNSENLNEFTSGYFDFILNVESSHCYSDFEAFCRSVKRVMKKGGGFILSDLFKRERLQYSESVLKKYFIIVETEDITKNVELSCKYILEKIRPIQHQKESYQSLVNIFEEKYWTYASRFNTFNTFYLK